MAWSKGLKRGARALAKTAFAVADLPYRRRPGPRILIYHQVGSGIGRQMEVTTDAFAFQIDWLRRHGAIVSLDEALARRGEPDADRLFVLTFDDGYQDIYDRAFPLLSEAGAPFVVYVTTKPVESGEGSHPSGRDKPLTWAQLVEMSANGATIGSHTHTHPDLRSSSPEEVEQELTISDHLIGERLGVVSEHFCYPYGYWSPQADDVVRTRYRTATLGAGDPVTAATDLHLIHRIPVQLGDNRFFFTRKMGSGLVQEERARRAISGYKGP